MTESSAAHPFQQFLPEHANVRQVAIPLHEVEAVTDDKFIVDWEADIIRINVSRALFPFAQQHTDPNAAWLGGFQFFANSRERVTGIQNIIQNQNVSAAYIGVGEL